MNGRLARGWLAVALVLWVGSLSAEAVPDRGEYAWRFPLVGGEGTEFRAASIPLELYRSVTDPTLRDIAVYNAAGEAVPRIVEPPKAPPPADEETVALALVPLYGAPAEQHEQLRLLMQQGAGGTTLSLDSRRTANGDGAPGTAQQSTAPRTAYIVDLRELEEPIEALQFDWGDSAAGFIGAVRVETGDDLQHWRLLARSTLADLAFEETRIEQDRAELNGATGDYLRITWSGLPDGWALKSMHGIRRASDVDEARDWLELEPVSVEDDGRTLNFDAGGFPPIERVNLLLSGGNVVVRARVLYRGSADDPWRQVHEGVFYHVSRDGQAVQSAAAALAPHRASEWQLRIASGSVNGGVKLQLGWRPERLLFLAQGQGPFELASGRARDRAEDYPQQRLLGDRALFRMLEESGAPGEAALGPREMLAGEEALKADRRVGWRTALVWVGLIGAVLLVGWLSLSLLRDMKSV